MNILMMTNTYTPIVGGVERSISTFTENLRNKGHKVLIVAPEFEDMPQKEEGVVRVPAIQNFNGTDFSVNLPVPGILSKIMQSFNPDIVHSHHPFLMGDPALRLARQYEIPLIFTYHTMFEQYLHYLPVQNEKIKRFVVELSCGYANLVDTVIVPTKSIFDVLKNRNVKTPIEIIPTSIDINAFSNGNSRSFRKEHSIPDEAYVIGHVGRLEAEKNLSFLARSVSDFIKNNENSHCLIVGEGSLKDKIKDIFQKSDVAQRLHFTGILKDQDLIDSYHAMDVFAFSSHSETQGVVLIESLAAGTPVIAIDAPGARDVVCDSTNGRLVQENDESQFIDALSWHFGLEKEEKDRLRQNARNAAQDYSHDNCVKKLIAVYQKIKAREEQDQTEWRHIMNRIKTEWDLLKNVTEASENALLEKES